MGNGTDCADCREVWRGWSNFLVPPVSTLGHGWWCASRLASPPGSACRGATAWIVFCGICLILSGIGALALRRSGRDPYIAASFSLIFAMALAGCLVVWARSHVVGTAPIERPMVGSFVGRVLAIEHQSAQARDRLVLATREQGTGRAIKVRVNLPDAHRRPGVEPGALVRFKARLMPPAPPMLPGAYNFARTAWFAGLAASGSALGPVEVVEAGQGGAMLGDLRNRLSAHILSRVDPDAGGIATALVTGDEGALAEGDVDAMRDAGLAHLLSISGLHVSAVIAATFFIVLRLAALIPWLTLRVRLPVFAAGAGALVGIGYTLLSGSEVPTVRSCIGALLVLAATVLGRESLSLRMLAVGGLSLSSCCGPKRWSGQASSSASRRCWRSSRSVLQRPPAAFLPRVMNGGRPAWPGMRL
ncbi:ComEC/Rec2 family competence protein [Novosphingobium colocasiae]